MTFDKWWESTKGANDVDNWMVYSNPTTMAKTAARAAWNAAMSHAVDTMQHKLLGEPEPCPECGNTFACAGPCLEEKS